MLKRKEALFNKQTWLRYQHTKKDRMANTKTSHKHSPREWVCSSAFQLQFDPKQGIRLCLSLTLSISLPFPNCLTHTHKYTHAHTLICASYLGQDGLLLDRVETSTPQDINGENASYQGSSSPQIYGAWRTWRSTAAWPQYSRFPQNEATATASLNRAQRQTEATATASLNRAQRQSLLSSAASFSEF